MKCLHVLLLVCGLALAVTIGCGQNNVEPINEAETPELVIETGVPMLGTGDEEGDDQPEWADVPN